MFSLFYFYNFKTLKSIYLRIENIMTIREITKLTGISSATICKAFKDPRSVKAQTWSILEPFYAKNSSSPSKSSLGEVHIIIPNITNSFFSDIVSSIVDHLYKYQIGRAHV